MTVDPDHVSGTIISGEDGSVYFLTDNELSNVKLPPDNAKALLKLYQEGGSKTVHFSQSDLQLVTHLEGSGMDSDVMGRT